MITAPTRRRRKSVLAFSIPECRKRADEILEQAPKLPHIVRVEPRGRLVARFVLPLDVAPTTNRTRHAQPWALERTKKDCFAVMVQQVDGYRPRPEPLPGRPLVRCVRFSATEPDRFSDWAKVPVDRLTCGKKGLRFLRDDRPRDVDLHQWWEPAPPKKGFALIEVWSG